MYDLAVKYCRIRFRHAAGSENEYGRKRSYSKYGILRAVGARSADVFKIFFSESVIITVICFVLSVIASIVLCGVINNLVSSQLQVTLLVFGPLSALVLLGIAAATSFIATFLPVYSIAKKKPVDSIRAL